MKIAILGWGSLIPEPRGLPIEGAWQKGGPELQIEFSRISQSGARAGCLTLVIDERNGTDIPTLYAVSTRSDLEQAITDLQEREGTPNRENIGFCESATNRESARARERHPTALARIREWSLKNGFDAAIWTALGPRFRDVLGVPFTPAAALRYVDSLPALTKAKAIEYINTAPESTLTAFRRLLLDHQAKQP